MADVKLQTMNKYKVVILFLFALFRQPVQSQPAETSVKVLVAPEHSNWVYKTGEKVKFNIAVYQNGKPIEDVKIRYEIGPEKMPPRKKGYTIARKGKITLSSSGLQEPGFLRCTVYAEVNRKEYRGIATAGFSPELINPTVTEPADFDQFWTQALRESFQVPPDIKMTLMPERCTEKVDVYQVSAQNFRLGSRIYGILCVPKAKGTYPAILQLPGAGIRPYYGDIDTAEKGFITLQIGIHGIPLDLEPDVYASLASGALNNYPSLNASSKDQFYYKRVIMGCIRANDILYNIPQFDGRNLAVMGGSQGGALAIATAALDPRVRWMGVLYPSFSDINGTLHGRAGGSPYLLKNDEGKLEPREGVIESLAYYDAVNFAKRLKTPGYYTWGYNDESCPPTGMYAVYNSISAKKELHLQLNFGHWYSNEHRATVLDWLTNNLKNERQ